MKKNDDQGRRLKARKENWEPVENMWTKEKDEKPVKKTRQQKKRVKNCGKDLGTKKKAGDEYVPYVELRVKLEYLKVVSPWKAYNMVLPSESRFQVELSKHPATKPICYERKTDNQW